MDEEEFVGTGEVVRIEKTEEVTDVAKQCNQFVFEILAIVILAGV